MSILTAFAGLMGFLTLMVVVGLVRMNRKHPTIK